MRPHRALGAFLTEWLDSRRARPNTLDGYRAALKPVIDHLATVPLQHLDTPHLDELVTLRLTGELNCMNTSGRGRYRTADRWCVKAFREAGRYHYRVSELWKAITVVHGSYL